MQNLLTARMLSRNLRSARMALARGDADAASACLDNIQLVQANGSMPLLRDIAGRQADQIARQIAGLAGDIPSYAHERHSQEA
ncbi:hypothetical protein [Telmatospirillum sp. J64-1]|uniref:hypothetical protein n=1 Tax=Telmatospirillum sp. J64-1 TaxID=2502183 RepID=UPI00115EA0FF|nr:hypothetical protein [Telmatospirillum sp. J64-1]